MARRPLRGGSHAATGLAAALRRRGGERGGRGGRARRSVRRHARVPVRASSGWAPFRLESQQTRGFAASNLQQGYRRWRRARARATNRRAVGRWPRAPRARGPFRQRHARRRDGTRAAALAAALCGGGGGREGRARRLATRGARALGATHIAADRKQLRLERHTYKRHGSPWRAAPESDIAYATAGPYPSRNPPAMARVRAYRPTGCGYNPKRGRPGTGRRGSVGPAGGRASSRGAGGGSGSGGGSSRRPTGQQRARSHQHPRRGC